MSRYGEVCALIFISNDEIEYLAATPSVWKTNKVPAATLCIILLFWEICFSVLHVSACLLLHPLGIITVRSEADFLLNIIRMSSSGTIKTICYDWVSWTVKGIDFHLPPIKSWDIWRAFCQHISYPAILFSVEIFRSTPCFRALPKSTAKSLIMTIFFD